METYTVDGVAVTHRKPPNPNGNPPIVFVHGGEHAGWCWENYMGYLAERGWDCHALDWYNHGASRRLSPDEFLHRSILDVTKEISAVSSALTTDPIVVGHSMGGLASLAYAAIKTVVKLVLITPVVPAEIGSDPVSLPYDPGKPVPVPPFEVARHIFFTTLDEATARSCYARLVPESPQAVHEATRFDAQVDLGGIQTPSYVMATGHDQLIPLAGPEKLARRLEAPFVLYSDIGHCDVLFKDGDWQQAAEQVDTWLRE